MTQTVSRHDVPGADTPDVEKFKPERKYHPVRWLIAAVILLFAADFVYGAATNPRLPWDIVADYLFDPRIMSGLGVTLALTFISMVLATVLGLVLALMALSRDPTLRVISRLYITVFRSVPPIVQLLFWYYLAAVLPLLSIGIPFGPDFVTFDVNVLISQFGAAILGLGLGEAAFLAEYFRGGILSVPKTQVEAAAACGLTPTKTFRRVIFPQAIRVILPSYGNSMISQVKNTSMVFVVGAGDLMTHAQLIYSQNFQQIPLLIVVIIWYLIIVVILTVIQRRIEAHYSRGYGDPRYREPVLRMSLRSLARSTGGKR